MVIVWHLALLLTILAVAPGHGAEEGKTTERTKDQPQTTDSKGDSKKKSEGEPKLEAGSKAEEKPSPKVEEPAPPKPEEPAKKPVTSTNLSVKLALMADPALFPFDIDVEVDNRRAVLTGTVSTEEEKARAADVARAVEGVESLTNKLTVSPAARAAVNKKQDEAIAHFVRERLVRSETLKAVGFDVRSENGVVHLSGKTRFQVIALEAAEAARQIPGVRAVNTAGVQIVGKD